jgi:hypothetical protein
MQKLALTYLLQHAEYARKCARKYAGYDQKYAEQYEEYDKKYVQKCSILIWYIATYCYIFCISYMFQ